MKPFSCSLLLFLLLLLPAGPTDAQTPSSGGKDAYVLVTTSYGKLVVRLFSQTPKHRDNFLKRVNDGYFTRFDLNRVVKNFVIQGGETDSAYAALGAKAGPAAVERLPPELDTLLFHKKGSLAAGRDDNPGKTSFQGQYYFVQGRVYTVAELDRMEQRKGGSFHFSTAQRQVYTTIGGTPNLDGNYTVFGEVIGGLDVIDKIAAVAVGPADRPLQKVTVIMRQIREKEAISLASTDKR